MSFSAQAEGAGIRARDVSVGEHELTVVLMDGRSITVALAWYPRLSAGTPGQRAHWEPAGAGYGIHWPELDKDISTEWLPAGGAGTTRVGVVALADVDKQSYCS